MNNNHRCEWAGDDPAMIAYHDEEWGVPSHDDRHLFEMLTLEGAQAGLSWRTILHKREGYREAFANFDAQRVARFNKRKIESLLKNPAIVRNRLKVESTVSNAKAVIKMTEQHGSLDAYLWQFVHGKPIVNKFRSLKELPAKTEVSDAMSKQLKKDGFRFVGSTICYALMQSVGMVNDHIVTCPRHKAVQKMY